MKPIFSVVTVHFNQLALLKSTVENIISQEGFGNTIEYIIVDGLSSDGTVDYLHQFNFEKSIQKIIGRDNGIYDAMNKAIKIATGEYVIFINAGDRFSSNTVLAEIAATQPSADVIYGDTLISYEQFTRIAKAKSLSKFWQSLPFVHQSVLVKRDLLINNLFNTDYKYCADYAQLSSLYGAKSKFQYYSKTFSVILAGGASDKGRIKSTKEVFKISKLIFNLKLGQKLYFRTRLLLTRVSLFFKKILPNKTVQQITQHKYKNK